MNNLESTLNILKSYSNLGEKKLEDGTLLIGQAHHIAPHAWLHSIHPALTDIQIHQLEQMLNTEIPSSYKQFLRITNGLKVFNTTLALYGLRRNYSRRIGDVWQPFNIVTPNTVERPTNASKNFFFVGGYDWDGSLLYIDKVTGEVHLCEREDATSLYKWQNFEKMIELEIERLVLLFDKNGKEIDPEKSTLPI